MSLHLGCEAASMKAWIRREVLRILESGQQTSLDWCDGFVYLSWRGVEHVLERRGWGHELTLGRLQRALFQKPRVICWIHGVGCHLLRQGRVGDGEVLQQLLSLTVEDVVSDGDMRRAPLPRPLLGLLRSRSALWKYHARLHGSRRRSLLWPHRRRCCPGLLSGLVARRGRRRCCFGCCRRPIP